MTLCKYEDITIANIEKIMETGYIEEIIFNADNKTIEISKQNIEKNSNTLTNVLREVYDSLAITIEAVGSALCEMWSSIREICESIINTILNPDMKFMNKRITKKKFMKLLKSAGMQRNQINEIIKNNTKPYTYARLYIILNEYLKE